jgi:hypothetical protein
LTLQTQGSFNHKLVMSKPAQLAKLIELRKNLRWENQNRWYRRDLLKDFLTRRPVVMVCAHVSGASVPGSCAAINFSRHELWCSRILAASSPIILAQSSKASAMFVGAVFSLG